MQWNKSKPNRSKQADKAGEGCWLGEKKNKMKVQPNEGEKIFLITVSGQGIPIQKVIF